MRRVALVALTATALLAASGAGGATGRPLAIGVTISQTGSAAGTAAYVLRGYQRWAGDANHHGGLLGRRVQLKVYDDASNPQAAAALYRKLITKDRVDLIASPYTIVASFQRTFGRTPVYRSAAASLQVLGAALATMKRDTVAGAFRIDTAGHQLGYSSYLMQWQGGVQELVWPTPAREAPLKLPA